ncbi:diacylglycerol kinase eta-like, partial [Penaeus chinensis]|uniref:diacylglycerol kinase eta-like n=1 Tax=Penaeus chinensis TaxID=139456 RepID=UPI001FB7E87F
HPPSGTDESWEATRPQGCSPLLVFVNSKSGDNQGVRFLRRFKQLLNPAQVFDLMNGGPVLGLRLFKCFNPFRILICSGDGSVGWVLTEIDKLHMTNQCQIGVLPLGTGNDLARVLGWGSACDDDTHLPHILEKYERATTKMLDRWSIMSYVSHVSLSGEQQLSTMTSPSLLSQVAAYEDSVGAHLATLLQSDQHSVVISSAKVLCETIKSLIMKVGKSWGDSSESQDGAASSEDSLTAKCAVLNDKLDLLLRALREESTASMSTVSSVQEDSSFVEESPDTSVDLEIAERTSLCKEEKNISNIHQKKKTKTKHFIERDALMSRANSLKKAVREIIEHTERAVDSQNEQTFIRQQPPTIRLEPSEDDPSHEIQAPTITHSGLQVLPTIDASSSEPSPCPSPLPAPGLPPFVSSITTNFPLPPVSPLPSSHPMYSIHTQQLSGSSFLQLPGGSSPPLDTAGDVEQLRFQYQAISPLPDLRRESHGEFEFPPTLPVPSEFADLSRKNSMQEGREGERAPPISFEDIEVQIQSSTDNLLDVGEDEPYTFEEKSITEIRDSLVNSLNNSLDIDEDWEEDAAEDRNKDQTDEEQKVDDIQEDEKEKTEAGDSDETDNTVRETCKYEAKDDENGNTEDTTPEGDISVIEDVSTNVEDEDFPTVRENLETEEYETEEVPQREDPTGQESHEEIQTPEVPLAEAETSESIEDELEDTVPPPSERYVEGAEATAEEDQDEEKGEESKQPPRPASEVSTVFPRLEPTPTDRSSSNTLLSPPAVPHVQPPPLLHQTHVHDALKTKHSQTTLHKCLTPLDFPHHSHPTYHSSMGRVLSPDISGEDLSLQKHLTPILRVRQSPISACGTMTQCTELMQLEPVPCSGSMSHTTLSSVPCASTSGTKSAFPYDTDPSSSPVKVRDTNSSLSLSQSAVPNSPVSPPCLSLPSTPAMTSQGSASTLSSLSHSTPHTPSSAGFLMPPVWAYMAPSSPTLTKPASSSSILTNPPSPSASRRISTGSTLKSPGPPISTLNVTSTTPGRDKSRSPERGGRGSTSRGLARSSAAARSSRKHLPIINPLVSLPMWPNIAAGASSGGLISKVLLANADALCAAASPLMDLDDSSLDGYEERCTMNNYFGIGIDAKITLDFHNKREEHPEKCRSRTKNFMWYGVLASKEWLCKTYKNLDQRVQLECDGERIPLPSLQGIVVLNIPSFMGGTNFWGGTKEDDCFLAPSFDDKILEVVAVFGSAQMAASRIINLQHHRIAQCSSIKITILGEAGEEGVPIQVDGEAWTQPPGIVRIVHKNRVQMLCRNRDLEVSLKAWEEKQRSSGSQAKEPSLLADEELPVLAALATVVSEVISTLRLVAVSTPNLENRLNELASSASTCLEKMWREERVIEGPNLRMLATELVNNVKGLHAEIMTILKEETLVLTQTLDDNLRGNLTQLENSLKHAHEKDNLIHFLSEEEGERKRAHSKGLFKLKLKREGRRGGAEREVREWGPDEVAAWLDALQLTEYRESFIRHDIRGSELLNLERRDLKELGITKIGHIKRIQQGIREIKDSKSHS